QRRAVVIARDEFCERLLAQIPETAKDAIRLIARLTAHVHLRRELDPSRTRDAEMYVRRPPRILHGLDRPEPVPPIRIARREPVALEVLIRLRVVPVIDVVIARVRVALPDLYLRAADRPAVHVD